MREALAPAIIDAVKRASPPVAVLSWEHLVQIPLDDWVKIATLIYIALQAVLLLHNHFAKDRRKRGTK